MAFRRLAMATDVRAQLRSALQCRRVFVIRHGNTGKAATDEERQLTETAHSQIQRFREAHAGALAGVTNVFASPVRRTMDTARLLVGPEGPEPTPIEDLYFGGRRTEAMQVADRELGYAPLRAMLDRYRGVYDDYSACMAASLASVVAEGMRAGDVLIVNHAGYLSLLAMEIFKAVAEPSAGADGECLLAPEQDVILDANIGEVCGFELYGASDSAPRAIHLESPVATDFGAAACNDAFVAQGTAA
mmetsp:Transcript_21970/g.61441  ORF Transcript_21970/g.61441 Transcript_21970/m.61441 type:complete len:246 (+) Transcript_21970:49-786(+)